MKAKARRHVARMFGVRAAVLAALAAIGGLAGTVEAQQAVGQTDVQTLNELAKGFAERFRVEHAAAVLWAQQQGIATLRIEQPDGRIVELMYIRQGRPVYYATNNANAADSVSTDEIQLGGSSGFDLDGTGVALHIWDGGSVRSTHQELTGRVTLAEVVGLSNHSTHVAGTMIAAGVSVGAHGMANQATLTSYDFSNDEAEMAGQGGVAILSNHSYGIITGWFFGDVGLGTGDDWHWFGDVNVSTAEDPNFGRYDQSASDWDQIAFNAPFWLIVKSAGNDRNDAPPPVGTLHWHWDGAWVQSTDTHPQDGGATGYDTISTKGNAKNILTVGAVFDVIGGYSGPGSVSMSSFSGWGPTDDGRIKPDLVGNGISLFSSVATGDTAYDGNFSGTSMSAPNVSGSLALWIQHYRATHGGSNMRAATVKGLAVHTADESGSAAGPDYEFGWGLLNSLSAANLIEHDAGNPEAIQELSLSHGQTITQIHTYNGVGPFKATICWTDLPEAAQPYVVDSTTSVLVNDLDLRVIGPGGGTVFPWILNPASPAGAATTGDNNLDNVEVVIIDAPTAGDYTVQITHKGTLSGGAQDFSLILSGTGSILATGACCQSGGAICSVETEPDCIVLPGDYKGDGTNCDDGNGDGIADACELREVKFSQPPDDTGEDIPSNIDWVDEIPNVVVADDFVSDGRPIKAVRWWGSNLVEVQPPGDELRANYLAIRERALAAPKDSALAPAVAGEPVVEYGAESGRSFEELRTNDLAIRERALSALRIRAMNEPLAQRGDKTPVASGADEAQNPWQLAPPSAGPVTEADLALYGRTAGTTTDSSLLTLAPTDSGFGWEAVSDAMSEFVLNAPETLIFHGASLGLGEFWGASEFGNNGDFSFLYALDSVTNRLAEMDTATGAVTDIGAAVPFGAEGWTGLGMDPTTGTMYASSSECNVASSLYTIDLTSGLPTRVGAVTNATCLVGIAIDAAGQMFGMDVVNDSLMSIDKGSGAGTVIGALGFDLNFGQGIDFDEDDGTLYLAAFNNGTFQAELRTVNTGTGASTLVGVLGGTVPGGVNQIPGLGIATGGLPPGSCLLTDNDFETGTLTAWTQINGGSGSWVINNGTLIPGSGDGPLSPCGGSFEAMTDQGGPGVHTLYQDVIIPGSATTATLNWTDMIRNHAGTFSDPNQEFRVEVWDPTNNSVLASLFSTNPGDAALQNCTSRSADISAFIGQTIRIAFTQEDSLFFFNVHLDDVCVVLEEAPEPDGWFISFHEPIDPGAPPMPPLALYSCDKDVVTQTPTTIPACDAHPVIEYTVNDLTNCCLVHANVDSRSGAIPAEAEAFFEEQCFEYAIDIQAVVGHEFVQDPVTFECVEFNTGSSISGDIWGWHTTSIERGIAFGLRQAFQSSVTMAGPDWLYGPWTPITPTCSAPNMSFELLTSQAGGFPDDDDSGVPDICEAPAPPLTAPFPHDRRKNRYISFDPDKASNDGINVTFKVELKAITLGSCDGALGDPPQVDFCRTDRKECSNSVPAISCTTDGDCPAGETCVSLDCNTCVGAVPAENSCISQSIDCNTGTCTSTGETCVNDKPNSGVSNVGMVWWVGPEQNGVHLMVSMPFRKESTNWANPVHVGDCEVVPEARYGVRAVDAGSGSESDELLVETTLFAPLSASWWGDCVGPLKKFCGGDIRTPECTSDGDCTAPETCDRAWTLPDGSVNFDDVGAALALVAPGPTSVAPDTTWVDLHGNASNTPGSQNFDPPNFVLNFSDIAQILSGFGGFPYKGYDPADCPPLGACCDGATCTEELEASCVAGGRAYKGDGITCTPNPCP